MEKNHKRDEISRLYDSGASLDEIVWTVGTDKESIYLYKTMLGLSSKPGTNLDWSLRRAREALEQLEPNDYPLRADTPNRKVVEMRADGWPLPDEINPLVRR